MIGIIKTAGDNFLRLETIKWMGDRGGEGEEPCPYPTPSKRHERLMHSKDFEVMDLGKRTINVGFSFSSSFGADVGRVHCEVL